MVPFTEYESTSEIFGVVTAIIILAVIVMYFRQLKNDSVENKHKVHHGYSYNGGNGPIHWKETYTNSTGANQSPINISLSNAIQSQCETLCFSDMYNVNPKDMSIFNDGNCVTLYARFGSTGRPELIGGPCNHRYEFVKGCFRWGPNDQEGTEHTVDYKSGAMEFQAVHVKAGKCYYNLGHAVESQAVLIVSYLYEISPVDNPYLDPVISALSKIQRPSSCIQIEPVPLVFFMPPFTSQYVSYFGSLTHPPCTEGVQWIVQRKTLGVSSPQVASFRRLCSWSGYLESNRRPVQHINDRDILYRN